MPKVWDWDLHEEISVRWSCVNKLFIYLGYFKDGWGTSGNLPGGAGVCGRTDLRSSRPGLAGLTLGAPGPGRKMNE